MFFRFFIFFIACFLNSHGQEFTSHPFIPARPLNSSDFKNYIDYKGNYFLGQPGIDIPLFDIVHRDISMPINLTYVNTQGNPVDEMPGIVGLGWQLATGGKVTRYKGNYSNSSNAYFKTISVPTTNRKEFIVGALSSDSLLLDALKKNPNVIDTLGYAEDLFSFSFLNFHGTFIINEYDNPVVISKSGDVLDVKINYMWYKEIPFFVIDQDPMIPLQTVLYENFMTNSYFPTCIYRNEWLSKTPRDGIMLNDFGECNNLYTKYTKQTRFIHSIVITDLNGSQYTFGNDENAITFSRVGTPSLKTVGSDAYDQGVIPFEWHLTEVVSPTGQQMKLKYVKGDMYTTYSLSQNYQHITYDNDIVSDELPLENHKKIQAILINPCYLYSIVSSNTEVLFYYSSTDNEQLSYDLSSYTLGFHDIVFGGYRDIKWHPLANFPLYKQKKLDAIRIKTHNVEEKQIDFVYSNNSSRRIRLNELNFKQRGLEKNYLFEYHEMNLPPYLSDSKDHLGYYNGRQNTTQYFPIITDSLSAQYYNARESQIGFAKAEILQKITFPTSGSVEYEYELHDFSKSAKYYPFDVENENLTRSGSGLRIKSIKYRDENNNIVDTRRYEYTSPGSGLSSGVRSHIPVYSVNIEGVFATPLSQSSRPHYYNKPIQSKVYSNNSLINPSTSNYYISYSYVKEIYNDNSFKLFHFKNYDNGYHDTYPMKFLSEHMGLFDWSILQKGNSLDLERGQVLFESSFNTNGEKVSEIRYGYNDAQSRFDSFEKIVQLKLNKFVYNTKTQLISLAIVCNKIFRYYPFLKSRSDVNYFHQGNVVDSVEMTENYYYDDFNNMVKKEQLLSGNDTLITKYYYLYDEFLVPNHPFYTGSLPPFPFLPDPGSGSMPRYPLSHLFDSFTQYMGKSKLSSIQSFKNSMLTDQKLMLYDKPFTSYTLNRNNYDPTHLLQYRIESNIWDTVETYISYNDQIVNIRKNGVDKTIVWGKNSSKPIMEIENLSFSQYMNILDFGNEINYVNDNGYCYFKNTHLDNIDIDNVRLKYLEYDNNQNISRYYEPNQKLYSYSYDGLNRLKTIVENDNSIVKTFDYNIANAPYISGGLIQDTVIVRTIPVMRISFSGDLESGTSIFSPFIRKDALLGFYPDIRQQVWLCNLLRAEPDLISQRINLNPAGNYYNWEIDELYSKNTVDLIVGGIYYADEDCTHLASGFYTRYEFADIDRYDLIWYVIKKGMVVFRGSSSGNIPKLSDVFLEF